MAETELDRLWPDPGPTSVSDQLATFDPRGRASSERPWVYANFAISVDGRAALEGVSGAIGTDADTAMLMGLRESADAVLVGAGTLRAERYGRPLPDSERRQRRLDRGLAAEPAVVTVTGGLDLPWDAGLFSDTEAPVIVHTSSSDEPPETEVEVEVVRHEGEPGLGEILRDLRTERGVEAVLCEGGPGLAGKLIELGLLDELFVTTGPVIAGGEGPALAEGIEPEERPVELRWLLRSGSELFARYAISSES